MGPQLLPDSSPLRGRCRLVRPHCVRSACRRPQQGVYGVMATSTPQKKSAPTRQGVKSGEFIVYPAHGVGQIVTIEEQEVAGHKLELFVIDFQKDKMRLKVPVAKATSIGMRKLSET